MFCDKCGKELAPGSIFCPNCGAKQLEEEPSAEMSASSSVSPVREAPSSQPSNQQSAERTTSPKHVTDESVYRKIICNNADYYLSQFQNILYGEKNKMNWASFFLSLYHAAYRGVWREWLRAVMWSLLIAIGSGLIASATIGYYPGVAIFFVVIAIAAESGGSLPIFYSLKILIAYIWNMLKRKSRNRTSRLIHPEDVLLHRFLPMQQAIRWSALLSVHSVSAV